MPKFNYTKITSTYIILEVDLNKLSDEEQTFLFGSDKISEIRLEKTEFVQEEDYIFETNLMLYMELDPVYNILKKGTYPLRFRDEKVQVLLSLSRSA